MVTAATKVVDLGIRVRELRTSQRLTQTDLGALCDLTRDQVAAIEAGRRDVNARELYPLAKALKARVLDLLGLDDEEEQKPRYRNLPQGADARELEEFARTFLRREASLRRVSGADSQ